jgi:anti-sigma factor RsiW
MTEPPTPSDRDDVDARIGAWLSGELADDEAEAFAVQLAEDAELAARVEAVRATRERLAGAASEAPPQGFTQRVAAAVAAEADRPPRPARPARPPRPARPARPRRPARPARPPLRPARPPPSHWRPPGLGASDGAAGWSPWARWPPR